jgi:hypothetical protein
MVRFRRDRTPYVYLTRWRRFSFDWHGLPIIVVLAYLQRKLFQLGGSVVGIHVDGRASLKLI